MTRVTSTRLEAAIQAWVEDRAPKSACPSEVARQLGGDDWRALMPAVREAAGRLRKKGALVVSQRGAPVDPVCARGPIRLHAPGAIDYRRHPQLYRLGRGERGVFQVEPYKSELLPLWRFRTPEEARSSAAALWKRFLAYGRAGEFVGMDLARKYLQMGWTRARRYARHRSGRKYGPAGEVLPAEGDGEKARAAEIFYASYQRALEHPVYLRLRQAHALSTGEGTS